jgi:hypothetical protein
MSSMPEQLALQIDVAECATEPPEEVDLVESVISAYGGDARAAVRELLADADFLRDQLYIASCLLSKGIGRGWKPQYERLS